MSETTVEQKVAEADTAEAGTTVDNFVAELASAPISNDEGTQSGDDVLASIDGITFDDGKKRPESDNAFQFKISVMQNDKKLIVDARVKFGVWAPEVDKYEVTRGFTMIQAQIKPTNSTWDKAGDVPLDFHPMITAAATALLNR